MREGGLAGEVGVGSRHFGRPQEAQSSTRTGQVARFNQGVQGVGHFHRRRCARGVVVGAGGGVTEVAHQQYFVVAFARDDGDDVFDGAVVKAADDVGVYSHRFVVWGLANQAAQFVPPAGR